MIISSQVKAWLDITRLIAVRYHSGAVLDLWEVEIPEETAKNPTGVFVRYTFADGTVYQYDTDQIQMNEVRLALGLH